MFTNNYQIYQQQNRLRWLTVLYDLALNRFRYITDLPLFNQRYFEKLSAQYVPPGSNPGNDDHDEPTCEEFARTLKI